MQDQAQVCIRKVWDGLVLLAHWNQSHQSMLSTTLNVPIKGKPGSSEKQKHPDGRFESLEAKIVQGSQDEEWCAKNALDVGRARSAKSLKPDEKNGLVQDEHDCEKLK